MLVLSRKPGERILIGEAIALTIVRIGPNTVRIGIDAPAGLRIMREKLTQAAVDEAVRRRSRELPAEAAR